MMDANYVNVYNVKDIYVDNLPNYFDKVVKAQEVNLMLYESLILYFHYQNKVRKCSEDKKILNAISRIIVNGFINNEKNVNNIHTQIFEIIGNRFECVKSFSKRIVKEIEKFAKVRVKKEMKNETKNIIIDIFSLLNIFCVNQHSEIIRNFKITLSYYNDSVIVTNFNIDNDNTKEISELNMFYTFAKIILNDKNYKITTHINSKYLTDENSLYSQYNQIKNKYNIDDTEIINKITAILILYEKECSRLNNDLLSKINILTNIPVEELKKTNYANIITFIYQDILKDIQYIIYHKIISQIKSNNNLILRFTDNPSFNTEHQYHAFLFDFTNTVSTENLLQKYKIEHFTNNSTFQFDFSAIYAIIRKYKLTTQKIKNVNDFVEYIRKTNHINKNDILIRENGKIIEFTSSINKIFNVNRNTTYLMYICIKNTFLFLLLKKLFSNKFSRWQYVINAVKTVNRLKQIAKNKILLRKIHYYLSNTIQKKDKVEINISNEQIDIFLNLLKQFKNEYSSFYYETKFYKDNKLNFHYNKTYFMRIIDKKSKTFSKITNLICDNKIELKGEKAQSSKLIKLIEEIKKIRDNILQEKNMNFNIMEHIENVKVKRKHSKNNQKRKLSFDEIISPIREQSKSNSIEIESNSSSNVTASKVNEIFQISNRIIDSTEEDNNLNIEDEEKETKIYSQLNITQQQFSFKQQNQSREEDIKNIIEVVQPFSVIQNKDAQITPIYRKKIITIPLREDNEEQDDNKVINENNETIIEESNKTSPKFTIEQEEMKNTLIQKQINKSIDDINSKLYLLKQEINNLNIIESLTDETFKLCFNFDIQMEHSDEDNNLSPFYQNIIINNNKIKKSLFK